MAVNFNQQNPQNPQGQQQGQQAAGAQPLDAQGKPRNTGFTNLKSVLNANQNNKLGSAIGQGVQNITNKTQGQTQQAQQQFNQNIGQAVDDVKKGTDLQKNLSNLDFAKNDQTAQTVNDLGNDQNAQLTANLRKGYQGPQQLQNADQLQTQAQQLGQTAQGLLSQGGRQAALQRFVNAGPNYTQGKQQLDTMLLGQNNQAINDARRQAAQTAQGTNQAVQQAQQQGQFTGQQFNTLGQDVNQKISGLGQNLAATLGNRANTMTTDAAKQVTDLKTAMNNGTITPDQYKYLTDKVLGGSDRLYNVSKDDLMKSIQANGDYNANNVANQQEFNARNALAKLAGTEDPNSIINLDQSKIGTAGQAVNIDPNLAKNIAEQDAKFKAAQGSETIGSYNPRANDLLQFDPAVKNYEFGGDAGSDPFYGMDSGFNYNQAQSIIDKAPDTVYARDATIEQNGPMGGGMPGGGGMMMPVGPRQVSTTDQRYTGAHVNKDMLRSLQQQFEDKYGYNNTLSRLFPGASGTATTDKPFNVK